MYIIGNSNSLYVTVAIQTHIKKLKGTQHTVLNVKVPVLG